MDNQQPPLFCFICGSPLEECGLGYYQCTVLECGEVFLPHIENDPENNLSLTHIKTPLTKKIIHKVKKLNAMSKQIGGERMRELATIIQKEIPHLGFCLLVYPFHQKGMSNYISNSHRDDMIIFLQETIDRLKEQKDFQTPNSN